MVPGSMSPTPRGKFAVSCMNRSQFPGNRQTRIDGTLPVPGGSGKEISLTVSHCRSASHNGITNFMEFI
jgi:hypothetical protein